jgi:excisionase family DNA binding protein
VTATDSLPGKLLTVNEASQTLGVHPTQIRLLIRRGDLAGERIGSQWVISRVELDRFATRPHLAGRPFSQRIAWSLLAVLEGAVTPWTLTREEEARVRRYTERPLRDICLRLKGRARTERLSVGPGGIERLGDGQRWIRGAGPLQDGCVVVYTSAGGVESFLEVTNAVADAAQPNLLLRSIEDRWWPFDALPGGEQAWPIVIELDRYDAGEQRPMTETCGANDD